MPDVCSEFLIKPSKSRQNAVNMNLFYRKWHLGLTRIEIGELFYQIYIFCTFLFKWLCFLAGWIRPLAWTDINWQCVNYSELLLIGHTYCS